MVQRLKVWSFPWWTVLWKLYVGDTTLFNSVCLSPLKVKKSVKVNVVKTKMAKNLDPLYLGLLGTAESFRCSNPPNIKLCIQCLQGVLNCKPPPRIEAQPIYSLELFFLISQKILKLHDIIWKKRYVSSNIFVHTLWLLLLNTLFDIHGYDYDIVYYNSINLSLPALISSKPSNETEIWWRSSKFFALRYYSVNMLVYRLFCTSHVIFPVVIGISRSIPWRFEVRISFSFIRSPSHTGKLSETSNATMIEREGFKVIFPSLSAFHEILWRIM